MFVYVNCGTLVSSFKFTQTTGLHDCRTSVSSASFSLNLFTASLNLFIDCRTAGAVVLML